MDRSISEILKDRVKHPILGGFMFTFLVFNFDVIYLLIMNSIALKNPYDSLVYFKGSFKMNFIYRIISPFLIATLSSLIIPFFDEVYKSFLVFISSSIARISKRLSHLDYSIMINDLQIDINLLKDKIKKYEDNVNSYYLSLLNNLNEDGNSYDLRECSNKVNIGDLVSV
ncbi:MAG: hypothetical protein JJT78_13670, partial [Leptospira sp.]|nr:hypothetical protein [Leptospira sp.]